MNKLVFIIAVIQIITTESAENYYVFKFTLLRNEFRKN